MQIEQLKNIIEAALLAASQPMNVQQLGDLFNEEDEVDREQIAKALEALAEDCTGRGVELREVASGFRYQVRQDVHPWISRMWTEKPSRYSRALLETLSLIAYRQPITRPEIEQIRGVVVSSNIVKTLEEREWIRVVGYRDVPGKPALFGTTRAFLDYFNLKSLDELPPLSEIRDMEDPQLRLDNDDIPARVVKDLPIDPDEVAEEATDTESAEAQADIAGEGAHEDTDDVEFQVAGHEHSAEPGHDDDNHIASEPVTEPEQPADADLATSEPDAASPVETPTVTAAEAANPADAKHGEGPQDTEEYRA